MRMRRRGIVRRQLENAFEKQKQGTRGRMCDFGYFDAGICATNQDII
jgi:hypothetical protein